MGQPSMLEAWNPKGGKPGGTETSKYLQEKKTIVIPLVVASETGTA